MDVVVVACNLTRDNVQLMFHRNLTNEIAHTNRYRTDQHLFTIFRYPDDVRFKVRFRVRSVPIATHTTTTFSSPKGEGFPPSPEGTLRQISPRISEIGSPEGETLSMLYTGFRTPKTKGTSGSGYCSHESSSELEPVQG